MVVSEKYKVLFIAIPKTATRSIYASLIDHFDGKVLIDHSRWIPERYLKYFIFTVIRNPYERAVSAWWSTCKRNNDNRGYIANYLKEDNTFVNFMRHVKKMNHDYPKFKVSQPQAEWIQDNKIDLMIPFERLDQYWRTIFFNKEQIKLGQINPTTKVQKGLYGPGNPEARSIFTNYLCKESIDLVNEYYKRDFELTHYENWSLPSQT